MVTIIGTGWLQKDAWSAYTASGVRRLVWELMLSAEGADAVPWNCEIHDGALAEKCAPKLLAGAAIIVRGELATRPFEKAGRTVGHVRYLLIERVEFTRLPKRAQEAPAPGAEPVTEPAEF